MSSKKIIETAKAPLPIGPYSQAVSCSGMLYVSGQIAINPMIQEFVSGSAAAEAKQAMENISAILESAGLSFSDVVKTTIFLMDMGDFAQVNEVYASYFKSDFPARETVQVAGLPKGARVEISVIAGR
jgi:2-iminobutanoate/2-iminopropanoate deaminase